MESYVHGYTQEESNRLKEQADTLTNLLHTDTCYPPESKILEAGCGIGAQSTILCANSPDAQFTSIDLSNSSLAIARQSISENQISNIHFEKADIFNLPYADNTFDHIFICFVLEHLTNPLKAITSLKRVLNKGGTITSIEGDHGSFYCFPQSEAATRVVQCLIESQAALGGNSLIGRQLYPLLNKAGLDNISVSPKMIYVDDSTPELIEGFSKNTFIAMVEGVKSQALSSNIIDEAAWEQGIIDLKKATRKGSTFCYTFFKAKAYK